MHSIHQLIVTIKPQPLRVAYETLSQILKCCGCRLRSRGIDNRGLGVRMAMCSGRRFRVAAVLLLPVILAPLIACAAAVGIPHPTIEVDNSLAKAVEVSWYARSNSGEALGEDTVLVDAGTTNSWSPLLFVLPAEVDYVFQEYRSCVGFYTDRAFESLSFRLTEDGISLKKDGENDYSSVASWAQCADGAAVESQREAIKMVLVD